jgi:ABC-2 type transport system ATP-binding protein
MNIVVDHLTKRFGAQKAVDDISFTIKTGEIVGFLGPNGAGKTTTMKAITCFMAPTSGDVKVGGVSILEDPDTVKSHIGYLPENNPLYPDMPVIDYLRFVAEINGIDKSKIQEKILEMIYKCGLEGEKHKKIGELSKGYQQRVGLAQALIHDPQVLILDEPTTGLDPNQIVEIRELIKKLGREKTVMLSSHILAEVEATCDRIIIINKGKIVADGSSDELRKKTSGNEVLKVNIEGADQNTIFKAIQTLPTVMSVDFIENKENEFEVVSKADLSSKKEIFKLCVEKGWYLTGLTQIETKLEDIFRELTSN